MSDNARAWLAMRAGAVPPVLEARMESAIDEALDEDTVPRALADAARVCMRDALTAGDERGAALHLLAADALITYACEAAAAGEGVVLAELAEAFAPERLGRLIAPAEPS